jgi:glycerol-3-phosphate O-acyltransferase/dihydroxyacetone phosphate acyltransferase
MLYALLRAVARIALRWYYRDIQVEGLDRVPSQRPLLLVVNHPNALVDALVVADILSRRVMITAKSSLFTNPIGGALLRRVGVVPIHRPTDEAGPGEGSETSRNLGAFRAVQNALAARRAVLVFPEGITHDAPSLAPLKTGAARMALRAMKAGEVPDLAVLPIGLTFERKDTPRSRVFAQIGEPIVLADWLLQHASSDALALTAEIDARLRAVTLNYATNDDAARAVRLVSVMAAIFNAVPPIGRVDRSLGVETAIARRIEVLRARLPRADDAMRARAGALVARADALHATTAARGILVEDIEISIAWSDAIRFLLREGWLLLVGGPVALWGWINHWLPFRWARVIAMRSVESAADPAMRTLVAGAALVLLAYVVQTIVVGVIWGPLVGGAYLASLPIAADINLYLNDRMHRAAQRARTFLLFHRDPELRRGLVAELRALRSDAIQVDHALGANDVPDGSPTAV